MPRALSKTCIALTAFAALFSMQARASFWADDADRNLCAGTIFAAHMDDFSAETYDRNVAWVFSAFEQRTGKSLRPGAHHKVALKIYTDSGDGMQTPVQLIRAVVAQLEARGFAREDLVIVDAYAARLREAGYLPPLSDRDAVSSFDGIEVRSLDSGLWWNKTWFYDNPLPVSYSSDISRHPSEEKSSDEDVSGESRKSYLPAFLIEDVDFWINLPVLMDNPSMEISGCLANATLWNVSNRERFFTSPANAPVAMAEIAAIPEFIDNWALSIVSLQHYQVIGGPIYNSNYVRSDPVLLAGCDPVIIDAWAARRLNAYRVVMGFNALSSPPFAVSFARLVGVGSNDVDHIVWMTSDGSIPDVLRHPEVLDDPRLSAPRPDSGFFIPPVPREGRKREN